MVRGLALVGLRGTGKSTVGRLLAERLGRPFADADSELERDAGRPIRAIFAEEGEAAFRDLEARTLARLVERPGAVLATGGGVVLRASNRSLLKRFGRVVWLTGDPRSLASRLQADAPGLAGRPALTSAGTLDEIAAVAEAREPHYREVADAIVDTTGRTPAEVAEAVLDLLEPDRGGAS